MHCNHFYFSSIQEHVGTQVFLRFLLCYTAVLLSSSGEKTNVVFKKRYQFAQLSVMTIEKPAELGLSCQKFN